MHSKGATIKEIAALLNISVTTVSRVLNGKAAQYRISQRTAELVNAQAKKLNFQPNQIAQNLRLQRTNTIGLVIPDISNPFFANLARTVEINLRKEKKLILLCDTHDDTDLEQETLSLLMGRKVDGLLIAPVGLEKQHFSSYTNFPMVMIDRYFEDLSIPYVATDNHLGAFLATQYLIERGHQKIACIQGLTNTISNRERVRGFKEAMQSVDNQSEDLLILGDGFTIENGYRSTRNLLRKKIKPTAIFALNNLIAIGVMQALNEAELSIPNDISLIAFDEQPYFQLTSPPITTIQQPIQQIGEVAVELLFEKMNNVQPKNQLLAPKIIERQSVRTIKN